MDEHLEQMGIAMLLTLVLVGGVVGLPMPVILKSAAAVGAVMLLRQAWGTWELLSLAWSAWEAHRIREVGSPYGTRKGKEEVRWCRRGGSDGADVFVVGDRRAPAASR